VPLKSGSDTAGFSRFEALVQASRTVNVEIVCDKHNSFYGLEQYHISLST
jgi:hypothetical protein